MTITQAANDWAFQGDSTHPVNKTDVCVSQGGIARLLGGKHKLTRVYHVGAPKGSGKYAVVMATTPGTELVWDNAGLKDKWIKNGNEACFRAMGRARKAVICNVDFLCHKWIDGGRIDYYKGWSAIRDIDQCTFYGGRAVGPFDVGEQENSTAPQTVGILNLIGIGLTHLPRISRPKTAKTPGRSGVKTILIRKCPKLKAVWDKVDPLKFIRAEQVMKDGKPVYWPDMVMTPDA